MARVLRPLDHQVRRSALNTVGTLEDAQHAMAVVSELELDDPISPAQMKRWRSRPPTLPAPSSRPTPRSGRQVNVRLRRTDFEALSEAAELLDCTPTQLARTFMINGARRVLYERRLLRGA